ncbi:MAG: hypothetical protein JWM68_5206 [Verrucomicrobiales bacterium]|nr:hypothetical protein [Verrucomicrobiales bacterium]
MRAQARPAVVQHAPKRFMNAVLDKKRATDLSSVTCIILNNYERNTDVHLCLCGRSFRHYGVQCGRLP